MFHSNPLIFFLKLCKCFSYLFDSIYLYICMYTVYCTGESNIELSYKSVLSDLNTISKT